jgi:hypothetical protein
MILTCGHELKSNPPATITWIAPDGTEVSDKNYSQVDGPGVVQLHSKEAHRNDSGQWTCKIDVEVCTYNCLESDNDGQTDCSRESFAINRSISLDVFCKYKSWVYIVFHYRDNYIILLGD